MGFGLVPSFSNERKTIGGILKNLDEIWSHLNVEVKHHDTNSNGTMFDSPFLNGITEINQGITGGNINGIDTGYRDGDKIRIKTINVKYQMYIDSVTGTAGETKVGHVMLIKHYGNFSGVAPVFDEIYDEFSNNEVSLRLRDNQHKRQYKILYYKRHFLSDDIRSGNQIQGNIFIAPKRRVGTSIEWEGGSSGDPSNGKYYLFNWCDQANQLDWNYSSRVTYVDN